LDEPLVVHEANEGASAIAWNFSLSHFSSLKNIFLLPVQESEKIKKNYFLKIVQ
jgi:hypothetical protein